MYPGYCTQVKENNNESIYQENKEKEEEYEGLIRKYKKVRKTGTAFGILFLSLAVIELIAAYVLHKYAYGFLTGVAMQLIAGTMLIVNNALDG